MEILIGLIIIGVVFGGYYLVQHKIELNETLNSKAELKNDKIEEVRCPNCFISIKGIDGKCEYCKKDIINECKKNIVGGLITSFVGLIGGFICLETLIGFTVVLWLISVLFFIASCSLMVRMKKIKNTITNNTAIKLQEATMKRAQEIIKKTKGKIEDNAIIQTILEENNELTEKVKEEIEKAEKKREKKEREIESKKQAQAILEEKNKAYEKEKKKIIEKYTEKVLNNPEILCLYSNALNYKSVVNERLRKYSRDSFKTLLWDFILGDIRIKEERKQLLGTFDIYKSKIILKNKDNIANIFDDKLKIELHRSWIGFEEIYLNDYLSTKEVWKAVNQDEEWPFSDQCVPIFAYAYLIIEMIKAYDDLEEFENNYELFTIYNNMYQAKMTDEIIVDKMYTLYTNLYTNSFKDKLEKENWRIIIELAKRKKLAEKYNIDSDAVIENKEQLIDYIVSNLIDFDREGQIIGIANILKKQEKMKTSLKFDIITNIDEILNDASTRMIKIKEEKELEELKAERDRLLKGDLSKEKNREELELSLDNIKTGYDFENYVANLYKRLGYAIEEVTKKSGDQGADVIATKDNYKYVIQAKYYSSHVGNTAVQEIVAAIAMYNADKGIVITNNTFTQSAKELAKANNIELVDGKKIEEYKKQILGRYQIKVKI